MFVRLRDFKRLIKEAYTGAGLYVARRGNQLLFGGSYWAIATTKESLDKKALAAVIELTGEMPEDGGGFQGDEGSQPIRDQRSTLEFNRRDGAIRRRRRETDSDAPCIKQISMRSDHADSTGRSQRVDVLGEGFIQAIDPASMNTEYEWEIEGPFINRHFPKQVYWKSEATTLTAFLYDRDDMKEKDLLDYLQNTKIEG